MIFSQIFLVKKGLHIKIIIFLIIIYFELKKKLVINQGWHKIVIKIDFTHIFID